jgi:hypothetical protein
MSLAISSPSSCLGNTVIEKQLCLNFHKCSSRTTEEARMRNKRERNEHRKRVSLFLFGFGTEIKEYLPNDGTVSRIMQQSSLQQNGKVHFCYAFQSRSNDELAFEGREQKRPTTYTLEQVGKKRWRQHEKSSCFINQNARREWKEEEEL